MKWGNIMRELGESRHTSTSDSVEGVNTNSIDNEYPVAIVADKYDDLIKGVKAEGTEIDYIIEGCVSAAFYDADILRSDDLGANKDAIYDELIKYGTEDAVTVIQGEEISKYDSANLARNRRLLSQHTDDPNEVVLDNIENIRGVPVDDLASTRRERVDTNELTPHLEGVYNFKRDRLTKFPSGHQMVGFKERVNYHQENLKIKTPDEHSDYIPDGSVRTVAERFGAYMSNANYVDSLRTNPATSTDTNRVVACDALEL